MSITDRPRRRACAPKPLDSGVMGSAVLLMISTGRFGRLILNGPLKRSEGRTGQNSHPPSGYKPCQRRSRTGNEQDARR